MQKNALSHVFGQSSLCVAMDFPGWSEAALIVFLLSGSRQKSAKLDDAFKATPFTFHLHEKHSALGDHSFSSFFF